MHLKYKLDSLKIEDYDLIYSAGLYDYVKTFMLNASTVLNSAMGNTFSFLKIN